MRYNRSGDPIIEILTLPGATAGRYGSQASRRVLINVQSATGGSGDDTIIGNSFNNILNGGIGADIPDGWGGQRHLCRR